VVADVTYKVSGGAGATAVYPIKAKGTATFSDSPIGIDRIRIAIRARDAGESKTIS
jgi:hypothetical protein